MNQIAQEHINQNFSDKQIKVIGLATYFIPETAKLTGDLVIQDYSQLEIISLANHELTTLTISNCPNLKQINVRNNQLTKLEINEPNQLVEIIAGSNELTNLDLTHCPNLKKLMLPDNPLLTELKNLNLSKLKEINISNTLINLGANFETLKSENKRLYRALNEANEARIEGKLFKVEPIQTTKQLNEAILRHLKKIEKDWRDHFDKVKIDPFLEVNLKSPVKKRKAKEILKWVIEAQVNSDYRGLAEKWSGGIEYNAENDFDGNLETLFGLLRGSKK